MRFLPPEGPRNAPGWWLRAGGARLQVRHQGKNVAGAGPPKRCGVGGRRQQGPSRDPPAGTVSEVGTAAV